MAIFFRAVACLAVAASGSADSAEGVVTKLKTGTYDAFLEAAAAGTPQWVLLDFYAPWCGHCACARRLGHGRWPVSCVPALDEALSSRHR